MTKLLKYNSKPVPEIRTGGHWIGSMGINIQPSADEGCVKINTGLGNPGVQVASSYDLRALSEYLKETADTLDVITASKDSNGELQLPQKIVVANNAGLTIKETYSGSIKHVDVNFGHSEHPGDQCLNAAACFDLVRVFQELGEYLESQEA